MSGQYSPVPAAKTSEETSGSGAVYDVSAAIESVGFGPFQLILLVLVAAIWMADAMEMMLLSFLAPAVACEWDLTPEEKAWGPQAVFLGMMAGAPFWGWFEDRYGRRMCYFSCTISACIAGIATVFSVNYGMLIICRAFVGFSVAGSHCAVVLYMEFLPMAWRAWGVIMLGVFWSIGAILEAVLAYVIMTQTSNDVGWRLLVLASAMPLVFLLMLWPWLPESARWDLQHGNRSRALETLQRAARGNSTSLPEGNLAESPTEKHSDGNCLDMCRGPQMLETSVLLSILWIVAAMGYYGAVLLSTEIFEEEENGERCSRKRVGNRLSTRAAHRSGTLRLPSSCTPLTTEDYQDAVVDSIAELPGLVLAYALMDRVGRRGALGVTCFMFGTVVALLFICWSRSMENVLLFIARGSIDGAFQIVFIFTPEIYPTNIRGSAIGVFSMLARIGGIATPQVALVLLPKSEEMGLGIYAGLAFVASVAACLLPIETAGKDLSDDLPSLAASQVAVSDVAKDSSHEPLAAHA